MSPNLYVAARKVATSLSRKTFHIIEWNLPVVGLYIHDSRNGTHHLIAVLDNGNLDSDLFTDREKGERKYHRDLKITNKYVRRIKERVTGLTYDYTMFDEDRSHKYRYLRKPIEVCYNGVLHRYMFRKEIQSRTFRSLCASPCDSVDVLVSRGSEMVEYFLLDDCFSWVKVEQGGQHHWRAGPLGPRCLFCIDAASKMLRPQTAVERAAAETVLKKGERALLVGGDEEELDWVRVYWHEWGKKWGWRGMESIKIPIISWRGD
jgi:hypothetical protein